MTATLETLREQIRSCLEAGDVDRAAEACLRGLRHYPRWVEGHRYLGEINLSQDALDAARRCFELVASSEPDNATPYVGIGAVLEHQQRFAEAVVAFERALDLDQTDNEVRQELVRLYAQLHLPRSVQTTRAALAHQHVRGHMLRQAQSGIDELLAADPGRLDLLLARARVAWLSGKLDAAEQAARAVIEISPDCVLANLIVAETLGRAGRADEAEPFLQAVRELDPEAATTSAALQDLLAEGVSIVPGLPTALQPAPIDDAEASAVGAVAPATEVAAQSDATAYSPHPADSAPGAAEPWTSAPLEMNAQRASSPTPGQPGMLDSLLKDLDQVWPERLDAGDDAFSKSAASQAAGPPPLPDIAPASDEELPPSFLGDVSEVIREFEDPADHYDLFADLPSQQSGHGTGERASSEAASSHAAAAEPFDFDLEADASSTRAKAPAEDLTLSGQHAIIDLSASDGDGWGAASSEMATAGTGFEVESLQSAERAVIDMSMADDGVSAGLHGLDARPPLAVAPFEALGSGEHEVIDLSDVPIASEEELADLLGGATAAGDGAASMSAPGAAFDAAGALLDADAGGSHDPDGSAELGAAEALADDADIASWSLGGSTGEDAWIRDNAAGPADPEPDDTLSGLAEGTASETAWPVGDGVEADLPSSLQEYVEPAPAADPVPMSAAEQVTESGSQPAGTSLAEVEASLTCGRFDDGWRHLQALVRETPVVASDAIDLLARHDGGSRRLRLQVSGDALMAAGKYWEALAKYAEALEAVRTPWGVR